MRIGKDAAEIFEGRGIVEAVTDSLVQIKGHIYVLPLENRAIGSDLIASVLAAKGDKHRQVAKVIEVMYNGRDAQRAHGGKKYRAVERTDLQQELWNQSKVIQRLQQPHSKLEKKPRQQRKEPGRLIKAGIQRGIFHLFHCLIELAVDIVDSVGRL